MNLRPYQEQVVEDTMHGFIEFDKQLVVCPTGSGKTIIFSKLAQKVQPGRTLILAHREELIDQAIQKIYASTRLVADKEKAEFRASRSAPVVVASVQSMIRRLDRWPQDHFSLVVADEAHHAISESWNTVLRHFDSHAKILGVTATPDRGDKKNLGQYFENIASEVGLFDLIHQGFLSRIKIKAVPLKLDLSNVRKTAGDFNDADLGDALAPYLEQIVAAICEHAQGRRTLVFVPLIATSKRFVEIARAMGLNAEHIDGMSPDRKEILERFARGDIDILSNAMLLTEGFDDPGIQCVVVLRPTQSRALYSQMVGRGTRIAPGKEDLLLLDFLWMHEKHNLMRPADLIAKTADESHAITELAQAAQGALDLEEVAGNARDARERKLREQLEAVKDRKSKLIDATDFFLTVHDDEAMDWEDTMAWHTKGLSPKQKDMLERNGFNLDSIRSRGHASRLIDTIIKRNAQALATPKQIKHLQRYGIKKPEEWTRDRANAFLTDKWAGKTVRQHITPLVDSLEEH